jgi:hypothetical protein
MRKKRDPDPDLETDIEDQLAASGRAKVVPPEGLVGAHTERRLPGAGDLNEPVGAGADVAPTRKAEVRERERHRIARERQAGSREELDRAAAEADRLMAERQLTAEGTPARRTEGARQWLRAHGELGGLATAVVVLTLGLGTQLARLRR